MRDYVRLVSVGKRSVRTITSDEILVISQMGRPHHWIEIAITDDLEKYDDISREIGSTLSLRTTLSYRIRHEGKVESNSIT